MKLGRAVGVSFRKAVLLGVFSSFTLAGLPVEAQNTLDEAHVYPRVERSTVGNSLVEQLKTKPIRVYVDLVLVPVTILDTMNRIVKGLNRDNFQVFDGKRPEQIQYFSSEDAPASMVMTAGAWPSPSHLTATCKRHM